MHKLLYLFATLLLIASCVYEKPQCIDPWGTTGVNAEDFREQHHYWKNDNFVTTDSIPLASHIPGEAGTIYTRDSSILSHYDEIVVANVAFVPQDSVDSVWVMVARDQVTMGWVRECEFLDKTVPDNFISRFISQFSDNRFLLLFATLVGAAFFFIIQRFRKERFLIVHLNDICSFYPTLLCLTMSLSATIYGTIQNVTPETWKEYYFHPTLNPFGQPDAIMAFLVSVWLIFVVTVAVVDDLRRQPHVNVISYLIGLFAVCMILYLVFSISVQYYWGYALLACYWIFALHSHWSHNHASFRCGNCGHALQQKGKCPHCGAFNE